MGTMENKIVDSDNYGFQKNMKVGLSDVLQSQVGPKSGNMNPNGILDDP